MNAARSRRDFLFPWPRLAGRIPEEIDRRPVAVIDPELCSGWGVGDCGLCETFCPRPGAIVRAFGPGPFIDPQVCDGCGRCLSACEAAGSPGALRLENSAGGMGEPREEKR